jgi:uncharacterized protein YacL
VDILCSKCGTFICELCYDPDTDKCINCSRIKKRKSNQRQIIYFISGAFLLMIGLFIASFAFIPLTNAKIVVFPLMFENVNSITAVIMSLMFFSMFAITALIPLYYSIAQNRLFDWNEEINTFQKRSNHVSNITETIEYMITTEIPETLKETIYLEDNLGKIILRSDKNPNFQKSYNIPEGFMIESIDSAYEETYLLLKAKLIRA